MWQESRTGVFTYFCILFKQERTKQKKYQKNKIRNFEESEKVDND